MRRNLLLVLLAFVALVVAVGGAIFGGLGLVLGAVSTVIVRAGQRALLILFAVGLLVVLAFLLVNRVDWDECGGECVFRIGDSGFDPLHIAYAAFNFLGWCLGLLLGSLLRPIILRTRASE